MPEEYNYRDKERFNFFKTSYSMDFTKKTVEPVIGHGKINAFIDGYRLDPRLIYKDGPHNERYIKINQEILKKSKTGISTYQYDYCGLKPKRDIRIVKSSPYY